LEPDVTNAELINVAELVARKVNKPVLQEALVESRLISRTVDREDVRKLARDHTVWIAQIRANLDIPEKRLAAFRALRLIVNAYLRLANTDHRIENGFRKAHLAAERGDTQRLQREIERLAEVGNTLALPELLKPAALLYLGAASDHARQHIAPFIASNGYIPTPPQSQPAPIELTHAPQLGKSAPASSPLETGLLRELRRLAQPLSSPHPLEWNIPELVSQEPLPPPHIPWPITTQISQDLRNVQRAARTLADTDIPAEAIPVAQIAPLIAALEGTLRILVQGSRILEGLTNLKEAATAAAVTHSETHAPGSKTETQHALALLLGDASSWTSGVTALDEITAKHYAAQEEKRIAVLEITDSIATLAAELPEELHAAVETKARFLARRGRIEELRKIHDDVADQRAKLRSQRAKIQDAAESAIRMISPLADHVPAHLNDKVLAAVRKGDISEIANLVARAEQPISEESASRSLETRVTSTVVIGAEPQPTPTFPLPKSPEQPSAAAARPVTFAVTNFNPRDRITRRTPLPNSGSGVFTLLLQRALQEMHRGSILGVIDHALDIILVSVGNGEEGSAWSDIGLSLLAAPPATTLAFQEWGEELADEFTADSGSPNLQFPKYASILVARRGFADAIAERFTQRELSPLIPAIAQVFYESVCRQSPYLLQDLAQGIANGVRYGDANTAKKLLLALGTAHDLGPDILNRLQTTVDSPANDTRSINSLRNVVPSWLLDAIQTCRTAIAELRTGPSLRATLRGSFNVQVPQSVQASGGFVFIPGTDILEIALQVGNPQGLPCLAAELAVSAQRHPWLDRDAICYLGPIPPKTRLLAALRLHLCKELVESQRLEFQVELRYKERDDGSTKVQDVPFSAALQKMGAVTIEDYDGASGKPIILLGDSLRLSSESVKNALNDILHNLKRGALAALIVGRRRRGKTSILTTIAHDPEIRKNYVILQDSVEDLPFRALGDALGHLGSILDRAARYLDLQVDPIEPILRMQPHIGWTTLQEWLSDITKRLKEPKRILLLLDEFQKWISLLDTEARTKVLAIFRGLMNRPQGDALSIAVVLSGLTNIREYTKMSADFLNAFRIYEVKAFSATEAAALIRSNSSIEFDARALARISELSGGNPFLINLLGNDIAARLRDQGRPYCFPDDVERVVKSQLEDRQNSRVWNFLQYLLKEGEEDHAAEITELPGLLALAWTLKTRGSRRTLVAVDEIAEEFHHLNIECDASTLTGHLASAAQNELAIAHGDRYAFASGWLGEWLGVIANEKPIPVKKDKDQDLILNRYRIVDLLDRGGQGTVYLGQDTLTFDSPVILKVYARTGENLPSISEREAKALCAIQHYAVVRCYSYGTDPEMGDVLVLEHIKGQTLRQILTEHSRGAADLCGIEGKISTQVKLLEQLASALAECHSAGVVHKDLKPENILLDHSAGMWFPKIIDFGISSLPLHVNQPAPTVGPYTPGYVAPERYRGEPRRSAADIYSLGVVAYELLTGLSPFPSDPIASISAQLDGAFRPLRELRPTDITVRLAELIEGMLSPDPLDRPNALTLASVLPEALQAADWKEYLNLGRKAYSDGDAEAACDHLDKAARTAKEQDHQTPEYVEALRLLVDSARDCGKLFQVAPQLVQPMIHGVMHNADGRTLLGEFIKAVLQDAHVAADDRDAQSTVIVTLLDLLLAHEPSFGLATSLDVMLKNVANPVVWANRETLYEVGVNYRASNLASSGILESWCIAASRYLREKNAAADEPQLWLRRAERLGVSTNVEFIREAAEVARILKHTANARELPPIPTTQEEAARCVGEDERPHLNLSRIRRWVTRVLNRHPYVQGVRRVRKDPNVALRPTRVLDLTNVSQHIGSLQKLDVNRIIPAVLDESYCTPPGSTVLRINILLAENTTPRQRECAYERLRQDDALFGEDT
jgi:serine/threonine-protein kinase